MFCLFKSRKPFVFGSGNASSHRDYKWIHPYSFGIVDTYGAMYKGWRPSPLFRTFGP